jgi:ribokinase
MEFDVVTFGSAVVDVFVGTKQRGRKVVYKAGSKILIDDIRFDIGGGATNTAVAFSRLGFKTGTICNIGEDNNGEDVLNMLSEEKVKFLGKRVGGYTGYSVILDSADKRRTILTYKGPGNSVSGVSDFMSKWLYFSSVLGKSYKTQERLAKKMKKGGTKLAFNPSEYLIKKIDIRKMLLMTDVLVLNREEAELVAEKYKKALVELCSGIIVVTDKNKLVYAYDGIRRYEIKPNKIDVVERTGAGDAFASGFVAGVMAGFSIERCLKLGLREAESVVKYFGAKNNLIRRRLK